MVGASALAVANGIAVKASRIMTDGDAIIAKKDIGRRIERVTRE